MFRCASDLARGLLYRSTIKGKQTTANRTRFLTEGMTMTATTTKNHPVATLQSFVAALLKALSGFAA
jgi:hypothetical protein